VLLIVCPLQCRHSRVDTRSTRTTITLTTRRRARCACCVCIVCVRDRVSQTESKTDTPTKAKVGVSCCGRSLTLTHSLVVVMCCDALTRSHYTDRQQGERRLTQAERDEGAGTAKGDAAWCVLCCAVRMMLMLCLHIAVKPIDVTAAAPSLPLTPPLSPQVRPAFPVMPAHVPAFFSGPTAAAAAARREDAAQR
jgi:hypothetical protein